MRNHIIVFVAALAAVACSDPAADIEGAWAVENMPGSDLVIKDGTITLPGGQSFEYAVQSTDGNRVTIEFQEKVKKTKTKRTFEVDGDTLILAPDSKSPMTFKRVK